ncbi:hypothetical protein EB809_20705 [Marinobacter sp. R17]|nr:hypothetical protein EB809_20705 [Marinobacter sp. R17]
MKAANKAGVLSEKKGCFQTGNSPFVVYGCSCGFSGRELVFTFDAVLPGLRLFGGFMIGFGEYLVVF